MNHPQLWSNSDPTTQARLRALVTEFDTDTEEEAEEEALPLAEALVAVVEHVRGEVKDGLGRASRIEFDDALDRAARWTQRKHEPSLAPLRAFGFVVLRKAFARFAAKPNGGRLERELRDEQMRDGASLSEDALLLYLDAWDKRIAQEQRHFSRRWHVPGHSHEGVREAITLRLLEAVKQPGGFDDCEGLGREASFVLAHRERKRLLRQREIDEGDEPVIADIYHRRAPSPEDAFMAGQRRTVAEAFARGELVALSGTLTSWRAHFVADAAWHGAINPARVARGRLRHRGSALRALESFRDAIASAGFSRDNL